MQNTFISQYLLMSSPKTLLFILALIGTFFINRSMEKRKISFTIRMISSIFIGLALGVSIQFAGDFPAIPMDTPWMKEVSTWYGLIGNGFMDLLKMIVIPIVFLSIVRVIMNMKGSGLGRMTFKTIGMLLGTTMLAASVGIIFGNLFKLGAGAGSLGMATDEIREVTTIVKTIRDLLPQNPFAAMVNGNVVGVIIFAAFIGLAIRRLSVKKYDEVEPFIKWIEAAYNIVHSIAMTIIKLMPYAVVALLANTIISNGLSSIFMVIDFMIALYVSVAVMFVIHLVIIALNGLSPILYIKKAFAPMALAFTSRSSLGTLPVTIETLTNDVGVEEGVASFAGSLGANMGMNGCAGIYPALVAVTIANMVGIDMNAGFYTMLIIVISISSLGIAGIPGTATIALAMTLSGMGLGEYFPLIGGIIAIDPILDMGRTFLNVNGTMTTAVTVAKSEKRFDKAIFASTVNSQS